MYLNQDKEVSSIMSTWQEVQNALNTMFKKNQYGLVALTNVKMCLSIFLPLGSTLFFVPLCRYLLPIPIA